MTDNALASQQYVVSNSGFTSHGMTPYNGITSGPSSAEQIPSGTAARSGPVMDYPQQPPNSPYYGGPGQPSSNIRGPGLAGYPKMSPARPGWPPSQPRGFQPGSNMPGQHHGAPVPTPTLNQLLQGPSGPEVRHPPGYPGAEFGGSQKMAAEEFNAAAPTGFGVPHPNWAGGPQRMGPGPPYPSPMMGVQNMVILKLILTGINSFSSYVIHYLVADSFIIMQNKNISLLH